MDNLRQVVKKELSEEVMFARRKRASTAAMLGKRVRGVGCGSQFKGPGADAKEKGGIGT